MKEFQYKKYNHQIDSPLRQRTIEIDSLKIDCIEVSAPSSPKPLDEVLKLNQNQITFLDDKVDQYQADQIKPLLHESPNLT